MQHIKDIKMYLTLLSQSKKFHMLILESPPGWGKSTTVNKLFSEMDVDSIAMGSYSTPLFLYNALVMHPTKTIILDDCAGLFDNPEARAILKAATWPSAGSDERRVTWGSMAGATKVLAPEVDFKGRLVLLVNGLPSNDDVTAFKSRSYHFKIRMSPDEIAEHLMNAAKNKKYYPKTELAVKVAKHLIKNLDKRNAHQFNLRTLQQGYEAASALGKDWTRALDQLLPDVTPEALMKELHEKYGTANGAGEIIFREFHKHTGVCRRTFTKMRAEAGYTNPARQLGQRNRYAAQAAARKG